jgi:hypothetical protein
MPIDWSGRDRGLDRRPGSHRARARRRGPPGRGGGAAGGRPGPGPGRGRGLAHPSAALGQQRHGRLRVRAEDVAAPRPTRPSGSGWWTTSPRAGSPPAPRAGRGGQDHDRRARAGGRRLGDPRGAHGRGRRCGGDPGAARRRAQHPAAGRGPGSGRRGRRGRAGPGTRGDGRAGHRGVRPAAGTPPPVVAILSNGDELATPGRVRPGPGRPEDRQLQQLLPGRRRERPWAPCPGSWGSPATTWPTSGPDRGRARRGYPGHHRRRRRGRARPDQGRAGRAGLRAGLLARPHATRQPRIAGTDPPTGRRPSPSGACPATPSPPSSPSWSWSARPSAGCWGAGRPRRGDPRPAAEPIRSKPDKVHFQRVRLEPGDPLPWPAPPAPGLGHPHLHDPGRRPARHPEGGRAWRPATRGWACPSTPGPGRAGPSASVPRVDSRGPVPEDTPRSGSPGPEPLNRDRVMAEEIVPLRTTSRPSPGPPAAAGAAGRRGGAHGRGLRGRRTRGTGRRHRAGPAGGRGQRPGRGARATWRSPCWRRRRAWASTTSPAPW